jgi:hypothetical protein
MWEAATPTLLVPAPGEHDFEVSIRESALMILVDRDVVRDGDLRDRVAEVVNGEGWRATDGGRVGGADLTGPLARLRHRLDALGLESAAHKPEAADPVAEATGAVEWRLTDAGRRAALAALRAQALRPRQYAGLG